MKIPCPTCLKQLEQKLTRKEKPYFVCESCGVQVFVRFQEGIERLKRASGNRRLSFEGYVFCERCDVAIRTIARNVKRPILSAPGIYCPKCDSLLVKASDIAGGKAGNNFESHP